MKGEGRPLRIAVIASLKQGMEQFVYRELLALTDLGWSISLFPTKFAPGLYNPIDRWRVHPWRPLPLALGQLAALARAPLQYLALLAEAVGAGALVDFLLAEYFSPRMREADVIYATFGDHKFFVGYFCQRITGKPLSVTIHAYELYQNPNPRLFRRALAAADQIVTVTEYNREYLAQHFGIPPARVQVGRLAIDLDAYRPAKKFVVLIVAFFVERKGHDLLFRAVKRLARDEIEVWVVGDRGAEDDAVDVRALAREIGVEDRVAFFGKLSGNALTAVYRAADVFCLPCHTGRDGVAEGFPTVLIEAMALGKPVITTRHVEIPRIVQEIVVDENDVDGLAEAIDRVHHSPELCARLGAQSRARAEEYFSPRNVERKAALLAGLARREPYAPPERARANLPPRHKDTKITG